MRAGFVGGPAVTIMVSTLLLVIVVVAGCARTDGDSAPTTDPRQAAAPAGPQTAPPDTGQRLDPDQSLVPLQASTPPLMVAVPSSPSPTATDLVPAPTPSSTTTSTSSTTPSTTSTTRSTTTVTPTSPPTSAPPSTSSPDSVPSTAPDPSTTTPASSGLAAAEAESLRLLNQLRASLGATEVTASDSEMHAFARGWALEMRNTGFRHSSQNRWYENIVWYSDDRMTPAEAAAQFHDMWVNSSGHYRNMTNPDHRVAGIGMWHDETGWWGVHVFR